MAKFSTNINCAREALDRLIEIKDKILSGQNRRKQTWGSRAARPNEPNAHLATIQ